MIRGEKNYKSIISLDNELKQMQDVDLLLERILLEARTLVNAEAGSIYVREDSDEPGVPERLLIKYSQNDMLSKRLKPGQKLIFSVFNISIDETTISGACAKTQELINIPDAYNIPPDAPYKFSSFYDEKSGYRTTSLLAIPLKAQNGRLFGVIQMINARDSRGNVVSFSKDDEALVSHFASSASDALYRAYVTRALMFRMIKMAELRDPKETGAHVKRVSAYSGEIFERWAGKHGLSIHEMQKQKDSLKVASLLHDVGKVAISDLILKKPARFTPEEFHIMQQHTVYGHDLFENPESSEDVMAGDIAVSHHENWDGTGYPNKLSGTEIPLCGRLVAIADVFDALSSKRVYKEAWDESAVLDEIRNCSGTTFDPELVDIFFEILPTIKWIRSLFPEKDI
jgi:HD-GYP domain-containing protein (c-di-GMP phosphodiesterase class II)